MSNLTATIKASYGPDDKNFPGFACVAVGPFETREDAEAFAATFPKYLRLYVRESFSTRPNQVRIEVNLQRKEGNARNDAGIKRLDGFLAKLAKLGIVPEFEVTNPAAYYANMDELNAAIR